MTADTQAVTWRQWTRSRTLWQPQKAQEAVRCLGWWVSPPATLLATQPTVPCPLPLSVPAHSPQPLNEVCLMTPCQVYAQGGWESLTHRTHGEGLGSVSLPSPLAGTVGPSHPRIAGARERAWYTVVLTA